MANYDRLPPGVTPLAAGLETIAALFSVSPNHFTKLVDTKVVPPARVAGGRVLWDVQEVLAAFRKVTPRGEVAAAPVATTGNAWD